MSPLARMFPLVVIHSGVISNLLRNGRKAIESDRHRRLQKEENGVKNVKLSVM